MFAVDLQQQLDSTHITDRGCSVLKQSKFLSLKKRNNYYVLKVKCYQYISSMFYLMIYHYIYNTPTLSLNVINAAIRWSLSAITLQLNGIKLAILQAIRL